jgi:hypothetical protein
MALIFWRVSSDMRAEPPCNAPETVFTETPARSAMSESDTATILTILLG